VKMPEKWTNLRFTEDSSHTQRMRVRTKGGFLAALTCSYRAYHDRIFNPIDSVITLVLKSGKEVVFHISGRMDEKNYKVLKRRVKRLPAKDLLGG